MPQPSSEPPLASEADRAACRAMIRHGSKSFAAASLLLPRHVREAAFALYAFCRMSDDLIDVEGGAMEGVVKLRERLDHAYARQPADSPVDRAFADVVAAYDIPRALPAALIEGLEWDVRGIACETLSDVRAYGARVAGSVGAMMAVLMGARDTERLSRACDLGVAMQLTNICRDVGEDAGNGRLYLPRAWLREAGIDPDIWLQRPAMSPGVALVVERLLSEAAELYERADSGISGLPISCRPGIFAARRIYSAIGLDIARHGFDSISRRARVGGKRKAILALAAVADAAPTRRKTLGAPLAETAFLVEAVSERPASSGRCVSERIVWVAELFTELNLRQRVS